MDVLLNIYSCVCP